MSCSSARTDPGPALAEAAQTIWWAGVRAVDSAALVRKWIRCEPGQLQIGDWEIDLQRTQRVVVVGGGKAGSGMARGAAQALAPIADSHRLSGWVNVPDGCGDSLPCIHLHEARPAGVNAPTERVVAGTKEILRRVAHCDPTDLCICLISGGGSALLALPHPDVTLAEQVALIQFLASRGANIQQLNTLRKQVSLVKGGRLARACPGAMASLIISDVLGDPLDVIASGPTVPDRSLPQEALAILRTFDPQQRAIAPSIHRLVRSRAEARAQVGAIAEPEPWPDRHRTMVIGNIQSAIAGAAETAHQLGWTVFVNHPTTLEGHAEQVGRDLLAHAAHVATDWQPERVADGSPHRAGGPSAETPATSFTRWRPGDSGLLRARAQGVCWISGGEPVVDLIDADRRGKGGRNQQLALAALAAWQRRISQSPADPLRISDFCLLSGGTDGEDGPTDAAGAWIDGEVFRRGAALGLDPAPYLQRNDAYHFFQAAGGLWQTGATATNVCDLRVLLWRFPAGIETPTAGLG